MRRARPNCCLGSWLSTFRVSCFWPPYSEASAQTGQSATRMPRCPQPTAYPGTSTRALDVLEHTGPALCRLAVAGQCAHHHFPPISQRRHHHRHRSLATRRTSLQVGHVYSHVDHFLIAERPSGPLGTLAMQRPRSPTQARPISAARATPGQNRPLKDRANTARGPTSATFLVPVMNSDGSPALEPLVGVAYPPPPGLYGPRR